MANHDNLPNPYPKKVTPLMDVTFAALGWLNRTAQAVGSERFTEGVTRSRFYLDRAKDIASTPAELAVITGMASSVQRLIDADAEARRLLEEALSDFDATLEASSPPAECDDDPVEGTDKVEMDEREVPQDPAA